MKQTSILHNQVDLGTPLMEPQKFLKRNRLSKYKLLTRFCVSETWLTLDIDPTKTKGQIQWFYLFVCFKRLKLISIQLDRLIPTPL